MTSKQCHCCEGLPSALQCLEWLSFRGNRSQLSIPLMSIPHFWEAVTWRLRLHCYDSTTVYWCRARRSLISCLPRRIQSRTNIIEATSFTRSPCSAQKPQMLSGSIDRRGYSVTSWNLIAPCGSVMPRPELPSVRHGRACRPWLEVLCRGLSHSPPGARAKTSHRSQTKLTLFLKDESPALSCAWLPWQRWVLWGL